jgi:hypothetical protein
MLKVYQYFLLLFRSWWSEQAQQRSGGHRCLTQWRRLWNLQVTTERRLGLWISWPFLRNAYNLCKDEDCFWDVMNIKKSFREVLYDGFFFFISSTHEERY